MGSGGGRIAVGRRLSERLFTDPSSIARAAGRAAAPAAGARRGTDHARVGRTIDVSSDQLPFVGGARPRPLRRRLLRQRRRPSWLLAQALASRYSRSGRRLGQAPALRPLPPALPPEPLKGARRERSSAVPRSRSRTRRGAGAWGLAARRAAAALPSLLGMPLGRRQRHRRAKMGRTAYGRSPMTLRTLSACAS